MDELLDVALATFATYGYEKTTLRDVASRFSVSTPNLYNYVDGKRDLYMRSVQRALERWRDSVASLVAKHTDPVERFHVMVRAAMAYVESDAVLRAILMNDPEILSVSSGVDRFGEVNRGARDMIAKTLSAGIESGRFLPVDIDSVTDFLFSTYMMFLLKRFSFGEGEQAMAVFDECIEIIVRGLLKPQDNRETPGGIE